MLVEALSRVPASLRTGASKAARVSAAAGARASSSTSRGGGHRTSGFNAGSRHGDVAARLAVARLADMKRMAQQASRQRDARSERTARQLVRWPRRIPLLHVGDGASVISAPSSALVVGDRKRWHVDPTPFLAQARHDMPEWQQAQVVPDLTHLPSEEESGRVSIDTLRFIQDTVAANGPVLNGRARLMMHDGVLHTAIEHQGTTIITPVGHGVIATGFPLERPPVTRGADARQQAQELALWHGLRRQGRVALGDEANAHGFDPHDGSHVVFAGTGGTAVSAAERLMAVHPRIRTTLMGRVLEQSLRDGVQFQQMLARYGDRMHIDTRQDMNLGGVEESPSGQVGWNGVHGDFAVSALGRGDEPPHALVPLLHGTNGHATGSPLFDHERNYLGMRIHFPFLAGTGHHVDVTGARSRFPIAGVHVSEDDQAQVQEASDREVAHTPGIFPGGYQRTLLQTHRYYRFLVPSLNHREVE